LSNGPIKIGWSNIKSNSNLDISNDPNSYSFDCSGARKCHNGSDPFGKTCAVGDIVGVMIDLQDKTISFSLNGELLIDSVGSETAFENIHVDQYVPAFTLYTGQKLRVNFGQDVNSLKFFTNCGLQEGYEPFAVNMTKPITFWYTNEVPIFENVEDNHESLEMIRINSYVYSFFNSF
jgi:ryanodine receptor 2